MYKCSNCQHLMDAAYEECPNCGAVFTGVRCENCDYGGTKSEFEDNGNRCPRCNSVLRVDESEYSNDNFSFSDAIWGFVKLLIILVGGVIGAVIMMGIIVIILLSAGALIDFLLSFF